MFKTKRTDYIAIALALFLLPLFFSRAAVSYLFYVASNVQVYSDAYNSYVRAPVGFLGRNQQGNSPRVPFLLFPAYSFAYEKPLSDMVRFVHFYKELLYGQRYTTPFTSPYIKQQPLFTSGKIVQETQFREAVQFHSIAYESTGRIIQYSLQKDDMIAGLTENFAVLLSGYDSQIFSSTQLTDDFMSALELNEITNTFSPKIRISDDGVIVMVTGESAENVFLLSGMLDLKGNKKWFKSGRITKDKLNIGENDSLIREVNLQAEAVKQYNTFELLGNCLKLLNLDILHGETAFLATCGNLTYYWARQIVYLQNMSTGDEMAGFLVFPGILFRASEQEDTFSVHFISDYGMREASKLGKLDKYKFKFDALSYFLTGKSLRELTIRLNYASILSENHDYIENAMEADFNELTPILGPLASPALCQIDGYAFAIYLAPNGVLYAVNTATGAVAWKVSVPVFTATTMNTHLSVYNMGEGRWIVILTMGHDIMAFDAARGTLKSMWKVPETVSLFDTAQFSYDDGYARMKVQVQTDNIHPYLDKRSLFIVRDGYMDVLQLSDASVGLADFWERLGLLCVASLVLAVLLRQFSKEEKKE